MEISPKKLKVYLDTSVISYLFQEDAPEKMKETRELWKLFEKGEYDVCLSSLTIAEIEDCSKEKKEKMLNELKKISFNLLDMNTEAEEIANKIILLGILKKRSMDDAIHIGIAISSNCDCILSWNFKHMVNIKTIQGVRTITNLTGYKSIEIWQPSVLLNDREE